MSQPAYFSPETTDGIPEIMKKRLFGNTLVHLELMSTTKILLLLGTRGSILALL